MKIQVDSSHYTNKSYLNLVRTITHWYQANAVANLCKKNSNILEIGPGTGHTTWMLRSWGLNVVTVDFDPNVEPDIVGDITSLDIPDNSYNCILAAQILEHLPFADVPKAISELRRVSSDYVVITLPAPFIGISSIINLPFIEPFGFSLGVPFLRKHHFDGQHYWELGKLGYSKKLIRATIQEQGLKIIKEFRPAPSLYCYFFITKKIA